MAELGGGRQSRQGHVSGLLPTADRELCLSSLQPEVAKRGRILARRAQEGGQTGGWWGCPVSFVAELAV